MKVARGLRAPRVKPPGSEIFLSWLSIHPKGTQQGWRSGTAVAPSTWRAWEDGLGRDIAGSCHTGGQTADREACTRSPPGCRGGKVTQHWVLMHKTSFLTLVRLHIPTCSQGYCSHPLLFHYFMVTSRADGALLFPWSPGFHVVVARKILEWDNQQRWWIKRNLARTDGGQGGITVFLMGTWLFVYTHPNWKPWDGIPLRHHLCSHKNGDDNPCFPESSKDWKSMWIDHANYKLYVPEDRIIDGGPYILDKSF